jgi:hypothetical protein
MYIDRTRRLRQHVCRRASVTLDKNLDAGEGRNQVRKHVAISHARKNASYVDAEVASRAPSHIRGTVDYAPPGTRNGQQASVVYISELSKFFVRDRNSTPPHIDGEANKQGLIGTVPTHRSQQFCPRAIVFDARQVQFSGCAGPTGKTTVPTRMHLVVRPAPDDGHSDEKAKRDSEQHVFHLYRSVQRCIVGESDSPQRSVRRSVPDPKETVAKGDYPAMQSVCEAADQPEASVRVSDVRKPGSSGNRKTPF